MRVVGDLNPDLTGRLNLEFATGGLVTVTGFQLNGSFTLELSRSTGNLVGSLSFQGSLVLSSWLASAAGQARAEVSGTFTTNGNLDLSLTLNNFQFGPGGAIGIVGPARLSGGGFEPATFLLHVDPNGDDFVEVHGQLLFGAGAGLPLLQVDGRLSTARSGNLAVSFGASGLSLSGFVVQGGANLAYSPNSFTISASGLLSIPGLFTDVVVSGTLDQGGLQKLSLTANQINLGGPLSALSLSGVFELERTGFHQVAGITVADCPGDRRNHGG